MIIESEKKVVVEVCISESRDISEFLKPAFASAPVSGLAAVVYVANLSQSSQRVSTCCVATVGQILGESGVLLYRPRNRIDCYRISLHSSVAVESWDCPPRWLLKAILTPHCVGSFRTRSWKTNLIC